MIWSSINQLISFENNIRRQVKNWVEVSFLVMKHKYPITVIFRDGDAEKAEDLHDLIRIISSKKFNLKLEPEKASAILRLFFKRRIQISRSER